MGQRWCPIRAYDQAGNQSVASACATSTCRNCSCGNASRASTLMTTYRAEDLQTARLLRHFVPRSRHAELFHPAAQRVGVDVENSRGALMPGDDTSSAH